MSFTQSEKSALFEVFKKQGFRKLSKGKYPFDGGGKASTLKGFFRQLNVPDCLHGSSELDLLRKSYKSGEYEIGDWEEAIRDWSELSPYSAELNTAQLSPEEEAEAEDVTAYIKSLVPVVNLSKNTKEPIILLDPHKDNRPVVDINPEIFLTLTGKTVPELIGDESVLKAMTVFDPYNLKSLFVKTSRAGSVISHHVNYYIPPRWRYVEAPAAYEGFIKNLIEHLFPNEYEREYVLDWLHYAVAYRNDTVLCLIGSRGTGKGILLKDILGQLIGNDYREIVNQEILTDKFNAAFKNKRYIFFDEVNVSGERELNKFKAFCNNTVVVEAKGEDSETIDNYTSLALSSNDKKDFRAEPQERRFSVPEITSRPLLEIVTEEEIESFCLRINDPESKELAAFGNFLLARKPKHSSRKPLRGKYFFDLCKLSMPEWKTYIIEYITHEGQSKGPVIPSSLTKKFKKIHGDKAYFATKRGTIETFLGDYLHDGVCRIGTIEDAWDDMRGRDTFAIIPTDEFLEKFGKNKPNAALDSL